MKYFKRVMVLLVGMLVIPAVQATSHPPAAIDTTAVTDLLSGDVTTALTSVGLAILALAALAIGFKWVKGLIFG